MYALTIQATVEDDGVICLAKCVACSLYNWKNNPFLVTSRLISSLEVSNIGSQPLNDATGNSYLAWSTVILPMK